MTRFIRESHLCSSVFICGFLALCITPSTAAEIALKDDLDRTVRLQAPAKRIVTLAPFLTELVFDVGAGERVVGGGWIESTTAAVEL